MSLFSGDKSPRLAGQGPPGVGIKQRSKPGPSKANGGGRKEPTQPDSDRGSPSPPPTDFGNEPDEASAGGSGSQGRGHQATVEEAPAGGSGGHGRGRQATDLDSEYGDNEYENEQETVQETPQRPPGKLKTATQFIYMILHNSTGRFLPPLKGQQPNPNLTLT